MTKLSRTIPIISLAAGALLALSAANVSAKDNGHRSHRMESPSRISDVGMNARNARASTRGANQKRFCPPGQAKKPGRGSAFRC